MLIGYVSDEHYLALHDVSVEFLQEGRSCALTRSTPRGAVHAELPPGAYDVELARDGFGAKRVQVTLPQVRPHHFRLLSDRLAGYMWPKWVRGGGSSEYCIHAAEECRVSLWRYGLGKELVRLIGWHGEHGPRAGVQVTPDGDYTVGGVQWNRVGYHNAHLSMSVPAPERSGLYYVHLEGVSGATFGFPWVVAPARPTAAVAVLAATNNWNAYNNFGGRSNYIHPVELPERPTLNARLELDRYRPGYNGYAAPDSAYRPLSFQRPERFNHVPFHVQATDPIAGRQECHTAPAEWRLLAWLEREGFAYDLWAEAQLHTGELELDAYTTLITAVHPEYWSTDMYWRVKAWVEERSGNLVYLGGNGICGAVEYVQDGEALRFLNHAPTPGPSQLTDQRFAQHAEPPARLTGLTFDERGIMTAAPFQVLRPDHWAFAGTGLREGELFGVASLHERIHGGASGHETDKLDPDAPPGVVHLATGTNAGGGGADMVWRQSPSGGEVFAAGSITYVASLLVDDALSQVTANVLRRFDTPRSERTVVDDRRTTAPDASATGAAGGPW